MNHKRLARVVEAMRKEGLKQILVSSTESMYYLTGFYVAPDERLWALTIDDDGNCALFGNVLFALDKSRVDVPLYEHTDTDDAVKDIASHVQGGRLGIDKFWHSKFLISLLEKRPDVVPVLGSAPVDACRMCKDAEEMEVMRKSSLLNDACTKKVIESLEIGQTEYAIARKYADYAAEYGCNAGFSLVAFGANAADPHHGAGSDALKAGDSIVIDVGLDYNHMQSDMTRTVFMGKPTDFQRKIHDIVLRANLAAIAAVRPGVPLKAIDFAARRVIEDAGYGKYFIHRTGHGIGLSVHEPPDVSSANEMLAKPGMVFSVEPGIYLPGEIGVRIEDLVCVTEDGHEVLNKLTKEIP